MLTEATALIAMLPHSALLSSDPLNTLQYRVRYPFIIKVLRFFVTLVELAMARNRPLCLRGITVSLEFIGRDRKPILTLRHS